MNTHPDETTDMVPAASGDVRRLSEKDFAELGLARVAYVKPVLVEGRRMCAIHAANGTPMGLAPDVATAMAAIIQHEMAPARLH
jgi:hypothetical protein